MNGKIIEACFKEQFGKEPEFLIRAPGRINLIGEHTDYNSGFVLPAAIDKAIYFAAGPRTDGKFVFYAADLDEIFVSKNETTNFQPNQLWANYLLGVIDETRKAGKYIGGLDLAFGGDVPLGAGLSSSAALESGMAYLLNLMFDLNLKALDLVHLAQRGENNFVGMKCGIMDMFTSVMGRADHVVRLDCRSLDFSYFPFHTDHLSLLLLDSGVKHQLIDSEYNTRREECEMGVAILHKKDSNISSLRDVSSAFLATHKSILPVKVYQRCRFVVDEIARVEQACVALEKSDFALLGELMFEGHDGLNTLYEVCIPETNFLVENARGQILGARQMGGGFGGCTINLLETRDMPAFIAQVKEVYQAAFGIELMAYPVRLVDGVEQI
jgi:galactokinase